MYLWITRADQVRVGAPPRRRLTLALDPAILPAMKFDLKAFAVLPWVRPAATVVSFAAVIVLLVGTLQHFGVLQPAGVHATGDAIVCVSGEAFVVNMDESRPPLELAQGALVACYNAPGGAGEAGQDWHPVPVAGKDGDDSADDDSAAKAPSAR